jgi:hypothetical protein
MNAIHMILHFVYLAGAILFIVAPFDRSRVRAPWARWVIWTVAALVLVLAVDGFASDLEILPYRLLSGVRGFVLGLLFALIVSGQLSGRKISPNETAA